MKTLENEHISTYLHSVLPAHLIKQEEPLHNYTYTKTGGPADFLVFPVTYEQVAQTVAYAHQENIPLTVLGNASNLIIKDGGIRGIVLNMTQLTSLTRDENRIVAQSGAAIIDTSRFARDHALTGLEFACGIPGSVGGAVFMNAGAYGGEVCDVLESVTVVTSQGDIKQLAANELDLSYRHSNIAEQGHIVVEATFALKAGDLSAIIDQMDDLTLQRTSKQPLEYPSCGSVFKRPPGLFAGKLIQDSNLQGTRIGGVEVSLKHAGFMVNVDKGTATDYIELIARVQQVVMEKFGVSLETEVKIIGEDVE